MKSLVSVATLAAVLMTTHLASADDGNAHPDRKDPTVALELSAGGTALSAAVFGLGVATEKNSLMSIGVLSLLVTPSFGQWYAHKPLTWGMGLRAVGGVAAIAGIAESLKCWGDENVCSTNNTLSGVLLIGGAAVAATGIVYDIATAGSAAEDFNRKYDLHVAPTVMRDASNAATLGVGIGGRF